MTNEQIVSEIRNGYSVTDYMQLLYESNLPLIKKFIKPYAAYEPMEDLVQESYFGLWEAVQHYETSANVRFMTYVEYWIRQSVQRYLEKCGSAMRIPSHNSMSMGLLLRWSISLYAGQNYRPSDEKHERQVEIMLEQRKRKCL